MYQFKSIALTHSSQIHSLQKSVYGVFELHLLNRDQKYRCTLIEMFYTEVSTNYCLNELGIVIKRFALETISSNDVIDSLNYCSTNKDHSKDVWEFLLRLYFNFLDNYKSFFLLKDQIDAKLTAVKDFDLILRILSMKQNLDNYISDSVVFIQNPNVIDTVQSLKSKLLVNQKKKPLGSSCICSVS